MDIQILITAIILFAAFGYAAWRLYNAVRKGGVSAVPMAARVSQVEGQKANPSNFLLMHAMGPNVAGVIGSAIAAGFLLALFG